MRALHFVSGATTVLGALVCFFAVDDAPWDLKFWVVVVGLMLAWSGGWTIGRAFERSEGVEHGW